MSYKDLWSNTAPVLKQSQENLIYFDNFISALERRIQVQETYADNLRQIAQTIEKQMGNKQQGAMIYILSAFKSDMIRRLNQTSVFVKSLQTDVLDFLKHPYQKQIAESATARKDILDLHAEHFNRWNELGQSKRQLKVFNKIRQEQFIALEIHKSRFFISKSEQEKILPGVRKAQKQYLDAQLRTKECIKNYNNFLTDFEKKMDKNLSILEQQERQRGIILLDSMKKMLVFQVSMMRNFQYDVTGVSNHLQTIQSQKDITLLVKRNNSNVPKHRKEALNKISFMDSSLYSMIKKTFNQKIKFNRDENIQQLINSLHKGQNKKDLVQKKQYNYEQFTKTFKLVLFSQTHILDQKDKNQLDELLQKQVNRNFAQLSIKHIVKSKSYNNANIVQLVELYLDKCINKRDVYCIRSIAKLILFQLIPSSSKSKDKEVIDRLLTLQIWKTPSFWNACLFEGIQQQLKLTSYHKNEDKKDAKLRQRNLIVAQIQYWCVLMVMMGYQLIKVEELAAKYSKFYNLNNKQFEYISQKILEGDKLYVKLSGQNKIKSSIQTSSSSILK